MSHMGSVNDKVKFTVVILLKAILQDEMKDEKRYFNFLNNGPGYHHIFKPLVYS